VSNLLGNVICHERNGRPSFSLRKRFGAFAGVFYEKLRGEAERAVLQGNNFDWHTDFWQFNGQDLDIRAAGGESQ
jgi:hypothetical protein